MLYEKDKEIIEKLKLNAQGKYLRFSNGDVEYIIFCIKKLAQIEVDKA